MTVRSGFGQVKNLGIPAVVSHFIATSIKEKNVFNQWRSLLINSKSLTGVFILFLRFI